jgi:Inward rectifier potassium channel C-terminal domain
MSETAVIARRDGILKLMFRIADIKTTQVRSRTYTTNHVAASMRRPRPFCCRHSRR